MENNQRTAVIILVVSGLIFAWGWLGNQGLWQMYRNVCEYRKLIDQRNELRREDERIKTELSKYDNDKFFLEKQIREKLGWVKPGEIVYKFDDSNDGTEK